MEILKEYTSKGMKLTHPSGVVATESLENLHWRSNDLTTRKEEIDNEINRARADIAEVEKIATPG